MQRLCCVDLGFPCVFVVSHYEQSNWFLFLRENQIKSSKGYDLTSFQLSGKKLPSFCYYVFQCDGLVAQRRK